jgi:hypothetical protein
MHPVECVHVEPKSIPTIVRREADAILIKEKRAFTEDHVFVQPWLGGENTVKEIADMSTGDQKERLKRGMSLERQFDGIDVRGTV